MTMDKIKQLIGMIGGFLGATLLFLQSIQIELAWFTNETIGAFTDWMMAGVPLAFAFYGIWKSQYILTKKARKQERALQDEGLKPKPKLKRNKGVQ